MTAKRKAMKKPKFKDRYVLGVGYPWVKGLGTDELPFEDVSLWPQRDNFLPAKHLKVPIELFDEDIPKYRLVLERVK